MGRHDVPVLLGGLKNRLILRLRDCRKMGEKNCLNMKAIDE